MYSLYFFSHDGEVDEACNQIINNQIPFDVVHEGDFDDYTSVMQRLDNIGSRWIFYPNAYILEDGELEGVYFENGLCLGEQYFRQLSLV